MKIDNKNLLKESIEIRAFWLEDDTPVALYTNMLERDVYVMHLPSANTEDILQFMKNVDESLRTEVYFVISNAINLLTIAYVYFNLPDYEFSDTNNDCIIRKTRLCSVELKNLAI